MNTLMALFGAVTVLQVVDAENEHVVSCKRIFQYVNVEFYIYILSAVLQILLMKKILPCSKVAALM
jgi:hypothetical protein